jgi:hypothetical protein
LVTIQELDALVDSDSDIIEAVSVYRSRKAMLTLRHSQAVSFVLWGAKKALATEFYDEFIRQMNGDAATKKGDPVHTFKQRMYDDNASKAKLPTSEIVAIGIKVINNFQAGTRPGFIKFQLYRNIFFVPSPLHGFFIEGNFYRFFISFRFIYSTQNLFR